MLIYGIRRHLLAKEKLAEPCPQCQAQESTELSVYQKYLHVFWIPVIPLGKAATSACSNCAFEVNKKKFSVSLLEYYSRKKAEFKTPRWTYVGLILFLILLLITINYYQTNKAENIQFIETPLVGDVYEVKLSDNKFTLYKIEKIKSDTLILKLGSYESDKRSGLYKLKQKGKSAYSIEIMTITKDQLKDMYTKGHILEIDRETD